MATTSADHLVTAVSPYVVPPNKLFIGRADAVTGVSGSSLLLDGVQTGSVAIQPLSANAGQTFSTVSSNWALNGLLFDV